MLMVLPFSKIILMVVVGLLFVMLIAACWRTTSEKTTLQALLLHLNSLQTKFNAKTAIDPEWERSRIEKLQNNIKASCDRAVITANTQLKEVFRSNCQSVIMIFAHQQLENKSAWVKLKSLLFRFDQEYFSGSQEPAGV